MRYAVDQHLGTAMSLSFGAPEAAIAGAGNNTQLQQAEQIFQMAKASGITVIASAGDWGDANVGFGHTPGAVAHTTAPNAEFPRLVPQRARSRRDRPVRCRRRHVPRRNSLE